MKKSSLLFAHIFLTCLSINVHSQSSDTFKTWQDDTFSTIKRDYGITNSTLYREHSNSTAIAFNWPQGIQFRALISAKKINDAKAMADEIQQKYWCLSGGVWGYNAAVGGCSVRFYDDTAWIALGLMELYGLTNDTKFSNRAKDALAYVMRGETPNDGLLQHERSDAKTCMCATAPAALANLKIYQATHEAKYLTDGRRLYTWIRANKFRAGGGVRGYETAITTQAALRLFEITGEQHYYDDAKQLGLEMETVFTDWTTHSLLETGQWGGHDVTAAYVDLYKQDKDINWLNIAAGYLSFLHANDKDSAGRYPEQWSLANTPASDGLLYQASVARAYAEMANTPGGRTKHPDPVAIFKDCNYAASYSAGITIGSYRQADLTYLGMPDNQISSVKVQPGFKVTFYTEDNFGGASIVKTSDESCINTSGFNNTISSLKVEATVPGTTVYKDCNYSGKPVYLPVGEYDMFALNERGISNDDISSLKISDGYEIEVFQNFNFTGTSYVLNSNQICLSGNGIDNWISSIKVRAKAVIASSSKSSSSKSASSQPVSSRASSVANSSRSSSSVASGACAGISQYVDRKTYIDGDLVKNIGNKYRCLVGGWCTVGGPYEPGVGWAWTNAWTLVGSCQ